MKNANNHDGLLKRLVKNQVIAKRRNNEPANLNMTRRSITDAPAKFWMQCEKISGVENRSPDTLRCARIVSGNEIKNFVQIPFCFWTELGAVH